MDMDYITWRHYPALALKLGHELKYKEDFAGIWAKMENELFQVLHSVPVIDILKINYGLTSRYPKACSPRLRKAFNDFIKLEIRTMSIDELLYTY